VQVCQKVEVFLKKSCLCNVGKFLYDGLHAHVRSQHIKPQRVMSDVVRNRRSETDPQSRLWRNVCNTNWKQSRGSGVSKGGGGDRLPPKTYRSNFFHHDFVQFGKQHSRYKAILTSTGLSQQCCEVYFMSLAVVNS